MRVGRFTLGEKLGEGTYGETWRASDEAGVFAVVKLLHKKLVEVDESVERFRREIRALEKLRHPRIVSLLESGTSQDGRPYYAMEWSAGTSLDRLDLPMPLPRTLHIIDQVLEGLAAAHALGIVHRDLKPGNLLVEGHGTPREKVRIIDFGLAKHQEGGERTLQDLTGRIPVGTPLFMAPEQCTGDPAAPGSDIYAVGCIVFALLTGKPPFFGESTVKILQRHVQHAPPRLDARFAAAPAELTSLVDACLRKDPAARPTATALRTALAPLLRRPSSSDNEDSSRGSSGGPTRTASVPANLVADAGASLMAGALGEEDETPHVAVVPRAEPTGPPEAFPDSGDALRMKLTVEAGDGPTIFLYCGTRLRFGRSGPNEGEKRENDLILRAFPRPGESRESVANRTRDVSRHHGSFALTTDGLAVMDAGSKFGLSLDGKPLLPNVLTRVPDSFALDVGRVIMLRGVVRRGTRMPVTSFRLERVSDGKEHVHVLLVRDAAIGSGDGDEIPLRLPGVQPRHVRIAFKQGKVFVVADRKDAPVLLGRIGEIEPGKAVELLHGQSLTLGPTKLRLTLVEDEDMKPAKE